MIQQGSRELPFFRQATLVDGRLLAGRRPGKIIEIRSLEGTEIFRASLARTATKRWGMAEKRKLFPTLAGARDPTDIRDVATFLHDF